MFKEMVRLGRLLLVFLLIIYATAPKALADNEEGELPQVCISGIMFEYKEPLALINGRVVREGSAINGIKILKIGDSWVRFEYKGEVFLRQLGQGCKSTALPSYRKVLKRNFIIERKKTKSGKQVRD